MGSPVLQRFIVQVLTKLIGFVTNLAFYGRLELSFYLPAGNSLGWWVLIVPIVGAVIVGLMARYGSKAIRVMESLEAMEQYSPGTKVDTRSP